MDENYKNPPILLLQDLQGMMLSSFWSESQKHSLVLGAFFVIANNDKFNV